MAKQKAVARAKFKVSQKAGQGLPAQSMKILVTGPGGVFEFDCTEIETEATFDPSKEYYVELTLVEA